jgi:hypothetical protein
LLSAVTVEPKYLNVSILSNLYSPICSLLNVCLSSEVQINYFVLFSVISKPILLAAFSNTSKAVDKAVGLLAIMHKSSAYAKLVVQSIINITT